MSFASVDSLQVGDAAVRNQIFAIVPVRAGFGISAGRGADDLTLQDLIAAYSSSTRGAFANPFTAANIGGNLLRRFNVTFDYPHETMTLVPNADFAQRDTYERSGLFLINAGGKITVVDARPGTPAAAAGIAKGDVIISVNGVSTSTMTLRTLRDDFRAPPGTVYTLGITSKSGGTRTITLTLRDYV